jgi:5'-nucleotidase (lipoprotein e(P4) family)
MKIRFAYALAGGLSVVVAASSALAADPAGHDGLNSTYWTQHSVEFKANAIAAYKLAEMRLDQALADKNWTAVVEQKGKYQDLPPAVILDVDETVLDNSPYQAWLVTANKSFHPKTWGQFVNSVTSRVIPGSLAFTKYADSKGVKVFYVSNRTGDLEEATRKNLEKFGYPMGGNVDTVILKKERKEWSSSKKGVRRAHIAKDYRVLLVMGDNLGDFSDAYKKSPKERAAILEQNKDRWGKDWIMISNPTYGSWESAPFGHSYKVPRAGQRQKKIEALEPWKP